MNKSPRSFLFVTLLSLWAGDLAARAQSPAPPLPPIVIISGNLLYNDSGTFSTELFSGTGYPATMTVTGGNVTFASGGDGYWSEPVLITPGYDVPEYYVSGYWEGGYWTTGYWQDNWITDTDGNYVNSPIWIDPVWNPGWYIDGYWVPGYHVDDVWSPSVWVSNRIDASGTYNHFSFQMSGGMTVQPADSSGTPWATTPRSSIPAVQVKNALWQFNASDTTASYDYYSSGSGSGYLWINAAYYGGYDPVAGAFSGTNSDGYFRDTSNSDVRIVPRNSDGSFLSMVTAVYGPPKIWSNGLTFRILTRDTTNGLDVYLADGYGYITVSASGAVAGLATGQYASAAFSAMSAVTLPLKADGSPLANGAHPLWGPPALLVMGDLWRYRGSTGNVDYYGGDKPGGMLSIDASNVVAYTDALRSIVNAPGYYAGGVFQNLPVVVRAVSAAGDAWTSLPSNVDAPAAVIVDGHPWYYSSTESAASGFISYVGPQRGQILSINGSQATISDPGAGIYRLGTFTNGKFNFPGSALAVREANADGTAAGPIISETVDGNLDVAGNSFSLGSWQVQGGSTTNGFGLTFTPPSAGVPALLQFGSTVMATDWLWTHAVADGSTSQKAVMRLDNTNRLILFGGTDGTTPTIVLDPKGRSRFSGPIRIEPQGDISMGAFTAEPAQP